LTKEVELTKVKTVSTLSLLAWSGLLSILPVSELRGGIPFAIANGLPWYFAYPFAVVINALAAPLCWLFLSTLHKLFLRLSAHRGFHWYKKLFDRLIDRARAKLHEGIEKWGWLGVTVFVAIPLPMTGAWTGTLGAWVLGLDKGRTMLAVVLGVLIAGAIVTIVWQLGVQSLIGLFTK
jgi:uncharacterized membrane protein